jgi:hypothetical protein
LLLIGQFKTFHICFLVSFDSFGQAVSEGEEFLEKEPIRKRIACGCHVC